jgi:hypothetical protein
MDTTIRARMVVINDLSCSICPSWRSSCGATQRRRARSPQNLALHIRRSWCRGCHPWPIAGSALSPIGFRPLSLGGFERESATDGHRCRQPITTRRCLLRPHRSLAARTGFSALRSDRGHDPRADRRQSPRRRVRSPDRPRRRGDRCAARSTRYVAAPHGRRPRGQRLSDRRSRRDGPIPSCRADYDRRTAHVCRGTSRSQRHRSASACP